MSHVLGPEQVSLEVVIIQLTLKIHFLHELSILEIKCISRAYYLLSLVLGHKERTVTITVYISYSRVIFVSCNKSSHLFDANTRSRLPGLMST